MIDLVFAFIDLAVPSILHFEEIAFAAVPE